MILFLYISFHYPQTLFFFPLLHFLLSCTSASSTWWHISESRTRTRKIATKEDSIDNEVYGGDMHTTTMMDPAHNLA
ncbi:hypothetical protein AHAS_Ahas10G0064100 [Arachis hypogaea]